MVNEPAFVQYLVQKSRSVPAGTDAATYGATLMASIVTQGLPRIPDELLERYYVADMSMLRASTTAQCAAIAQSRLSTKDRYNLLGRLPDDALDAYYDALQAAIGQEIGTASSTRLTPAQAKAAEQKLAEAMVALPGQQFERLSALYEAQARGMASDEDQCTIVRLVFAAAASVKPPERYWLWRHFLLQ